MTAIATAVNADGHREILGVDVFTAEDGAAWTTSCVDSWRAAWPGGKLMISDSHEGLKQAIAAVLPGAGWQRCRVDFVRNLLTKVPKSAQTLVATLVRSIFAQPDMVAVWAQHERNRRAAAVAIRAGSQPARRGRTPRSWPSPHFPRSIGARSGPTTSRSD